MPGEIWDDHQVYLADNVIIVLLLFFEYSQGRGWGSAQTLCSERSELRRVERADASEASESSRKRAVAYLKLGTRQVKTHITQTKYCRYHRLNAAHETGTHIGSENNRQT